MLIKITHIKKKTSREIQLKDYNKKPKDTWTNSKQNFSWHRQDKCPMLHSRQNFIFFPKLKNYQRCLGPPDTIRALKTDMIQKFIIVHNTCPSQNKEF